MHTVSHRPEPIARFTGLVESIGYGVFPEDGSVVAGLPNIERTLNWVHLSSQFPVRIRIQNPDPDLFRIGATAVTVVRWLDVQRLLIAGAHTVAGPTLAGSPAHARAS
jgi:multidrug resistance efflux pump